MIDQLLAAVHIAAACEAIASAGNSRMSENRIPHFVDGDYSPRSAIGILVKDSRRRAEASRIRPCPVLLPTSP